MTKIDFNSFHEWASNSMKGGYAPSTVESYGRLLKRLLTWLNKANLPHKLNQEAIDTYFKGLGKKVKGKGNRKRNPLYFGFLRALQECYDPNEEIHLKIPKKRGVGSRNDALEDKEHTFLEKEDIKSIYKKCIELSKLAKIKGNKRKNIEWFQIYIMCRIYVETGLRKMELIDTPRKYIYIYENMIKGVGKRGKRFEVTFSNKTKKELNRWLDYRKDEYPFRFKKSNGKYIKSQHSHLYKKFVELGKHIGIEYLHPHQLRHFLGHHLRANLGWDLEQVRATLRHEKITTTQIYSTASETEIRNKKKKELFKEK